MEFREPYLVMYTADAPEFGDDNDTTQDNDDDGKDADEDDAI